jgi:hypothetical protein
MTKILHMVQDEQLSSAGVIATAGPTHDGGRVASIQWYKSTTGAWQRRSRFQVIKQLRPLPSFQLSMFPTHHSHRTNKFVYGSLLIQSQYFKSVSVHRIQVRDSFQLKRPSFTPSTDPCSKFQPQAIQPPRQWCKLPSDLPSQTLQ